MHVLVVMTGCETNAMTQERELLEDAEEICGRRGAFDTANDIILPTHHAPHTSKASMK